MREASEGQLTAGDGTTLAYRDHGGSGRGLVLLHGGGANLVSMDQWAARLGKARRAVALDIRACGQSGDPARFRLRDAARDVAALAEHLDLGPVDVVGHSLGGFVGAWYGTDEPSARVVSIDGFGPGMVHVGDESDQEEFRAFQNAMRSAFFVHPSSLTAPRHEDSRILRRGFSCTRGFDRAVPGWTRGWRSSPTSAACNAGSWPTRWSPEP